MRSFEAVFGSMRLLQSHTSRSSWCEALKPFLVQCAYFRYIRPNPVDAKLWTRFWFNAPTLVTDAQIWFWGIFASLFIPYAYFWLLASICYAIGPACLNINLVQIRRNTGVSITAGDVFGWWRRCFSLTKPNILFFLVWNVCKFS
jgi:hypothetical protein